MNREQAQLRMLLSSDYLNELETRIVSFRRKTWLERHWQGALFVVAFALYFASGWF